MVLPNMSFLSPYGVCNALLQRTWQPQVLRTLVAPARFTNDSEVFVLASRNASESLSVRVVNVNASSQRLRIEWAAALAGGTCRERDALASVLGMQADSLTAVNTPARPENVAIKQGVPLAIDGHAVVFVAPGLSVSVITVRLTGCVGRPVQPSHERALVDGLCAARTLRL